MTDQEIAGLLKATSFRYSNEIELQDGIASVLTSHGVAFEREVELGRRDRIDFMAGNIGIEVKVVSGGLNDVMRQLQRYLQSDKLDSLIVAATSQRLCSLLPRELSGKRIVFARVGGVL